MKAVKKKAVPVSARATQRVNCTTKVRQKPSRGNMDSGPPPATPTGWLRLDPAKLAFFQRDLHGVSDKAHFLDTMTEACVMGQQGINPLVDDMLAERLSYRENASRYGRIGRAKQLEAAGPPPATPGHTKPNRQTEHTNVPKSKKGEISDSVESDAWKFGEGNCPKEEIACLLDEQLPAWAVGFCEEDNPPRAMNAYRKRIREIGPEAFRSELTAFVAEIEAGEAVNNRGAAFTKRLLDLSESMEAQKGVRESLEISKKP